MVGSNLWGVLLVGGEGLPDPPDRLDADTAETVLLVLAGVCVIGMLVVLRTVQKMATRMALLGLLLAVGVTMYLQRENLEDCAGQCTCRIFAQDIDMPEVGQRCP